MADSTNALVPSRSEALPSPAAVRDMAQRIERLEDVVAVLCDTKALEDRIVQRVVSQVSAHGEPRYSAHRETLDMMPLQVDAVPVSHSNGMGSVVTASPPTATFAEFVLPDGATSSSSTASLASFGLPLPDAPLVPASKTTAVKLSLGMLPGSSLLQSIWWDIKTFWAMWRDPLYTMTIAGRLVPFLALFFVLAVPLLRTLPVLGEFLKVFLPDFGAFFGNLLNIVLLYVTFKVISRELQRYQEFRAKRRR
jgi:hypothetical protein